MTDKDDLDECYSSSELESNSIIDASHERPPHCAADISVLCTDISHMSLAYANAPRNDLQRSNLRMVAQPRRLLPHLLKDIQQPPITDSGAYDYAKLRRATLRRLIISRDILKSPDVHEMSTRSCIQTLQEDDKGLGRAIINYTDHDFKRDIRTFLPRQLETTMSCQQPRTQGYPSKVRATENGLRSAL